MWDGIQKRIDRAVSGARNALLGIISSTIKADSEVYIKLSDDDEIRDVRVVNPHGFYSLPNPGLFGQVVFNNTGKKASLVGVEDRNAKPVSVDIGEVLVYNPQAKSYIVLKNDKSIEISNGAKIVMNADGSMTISSPEKISINAPKGISLSATDPTGSGVSITGKDSSGSW